MATKIDKLIYDLSELFPQRIVSSRQLTEVINGLKFDRIQIQEAMKRDRIVPDNSIKATFTPPDVSLEFPYEYYRLV